MLTNHKIHVTSEKFAREAFILMSILGNLPFLTLFLITQAVWKTRSSTVNYDFCDPKTL